MSNDHELSEALVSIDVEATGRIPGPYSMISVGAVAFTESGEEISKFKINLKELPGSTREEYVMDNFWKKLPGGLEGEAWKAATENAVEAGQAMSELRDWFKSLPGKPKLIGWPLMIDFMCVYWYYIEFLGEEPPFGFDGIDIKTMAATVLNVPHSKVSRTLVRERFAIPHREFTHDALDDAVQQAELFFALRKLQQSVASEVHLSPERQALLCLGVAALSATLGFLASFTIGTRGFYWITIIGALIPFSLGLWLIGRESRGRTAR